MITKLGIGILILVFVTGRYISYANKQEAKTATATCVCGPNCNGVCVPGCNCNTALRDAN